MLFSELGARLEAIVEVVVVWQSIQFYSSFGLFHCVGVATAAASVGAQPTRQPSFR